MAPLLAAGVGLQCAPPPSQHRVTAAPEITPAQVSRITALEVVEETSDEREEGTSGLENGPTAHPPIAALLRALHNAQKFKDKRNAVKALARHPDGAPALLGILARQADAKVRKEIVNRISGPDHPEVRSALLEIIRSDPSDEVAFAASDRLRRWSLAPLSGKLAERSDDALKRGDANAALAAALQEERHRVAGKGNDMPAFMRQAPPVFAVKTRQSDRVSFAVLGDFGTGSPKQHAVAKAIARSHNRETFDFGITLGDNFYPRGMTSPTDPRWQTLWEDHYDHLQLRFYATLGNHDWAGPDSPAAEIMRTDLSRSFALPASHYSFTAGPVQFFAIDTSTLTRAQLFWLDGELRRSSAPWKIVYGHHPIYSAGWHGDGSEMIEKLLPLLRGRASLYLAGHEHDLQHLKPVDNLELFVVGGGGQTTRVIEPNDRSLFAASANGFAAIEASAERIDIRLIGTDHKTMYRHSITK